MLTTIHLAGRRRSALKTAKKPEFVNIHTSCCAQKCALKSAIFSAHDFLEIYNPTHALAAKKRLHIR